MISRIARITFRSVQDVYGGAGAIEQAFDRTLDVSLHPRGLDMLMNLVANLALPSGAEVLDLGCWDGKYSVELARRFGFRVLGIDPVNRHISDGTRMLAELNSTEPDVAARVRLEVGATGGLPSVSGSLDLIWCRDVLVHVSDLKAAFAECSRALRPGGYMVIYQMFATDWLDQREADRLWPPVGIFASSTDRRAFEAAIAEAGFDIVDCQELTSEWRENLEENSKASTARQLLHAARLLRAPEHYIAEHGEVAYGVMLSNCLWGVYQMIGKLSPRSYVLRR
ncbi:MAG: class I SAM-dependent methyltransferase [Candidatus Dormibacteraeota bacterium]|nr:class I SAM-dependent methyltransferase [Candidatus Dormibacteraeota bacterium]